MDQRIVSLHKRKWFRALDENIMMAKVVIDDGETSESVLICFEWGICPLCDGKGHHVNPGIDCNGLTQEDFEADPGFREDYIAGVYDVQCFSCEGRRVVPILDEVHTEPTLVKAVKDQIAREDELAREIAWEEKHGF